MGNKAEFFKGFIKENPIFVLALGLCPSLAVSSKLFYALGMSAGTLFVLLGSNVLISLLRKVIPEEIHIPAYIIIIASFVTIVDLALQAFSPVLSEALGVYVQLIVVNCIILGRAEAFASKNSVGASALDAVSMGLGFTFGLSVIALVREILGYGTITLFEQGEKIVGLNIPLLSESPIAAVTLPAGALLVMGLLKAVFNWIQDRFVKGDA